MDVYHKLREKLNAHPTGAPERPEIFEILHILFTPEEAELALHLSFILKPVDEIATRAGQSVEEVFATYEKLADKGVIMSRTRDGKKSYMLLPLMPGIFEFPFMKHKYLDLDFDRLAKLWHQYYDTGWGHEFHGSKTNMSRIIPVRKAISATSEVLPFEEVSRTIERARSISVADCACRVSAKKCDKPLEVCMQFDGSAEFLVEREMARFVTKEEALKILETAEEAGLVHLTSNTADKMGFICNCCSCCCKALGAVTMLKATASHPVSNFHASVNADDCTACALCEDRCPAKAISVNDMAVVDIRLCIGCGLCASECPTEAINLVRKADSIEPPAGAKELGLKVAQEKNRVDAFLANLT